MSFLEIPVDAELLLRQRRPQDADELWALTDANRAYLRAWLPWLDHCRGVDDSRRNIETGLKSAAEGKSLDVAIWKNDRIVGVTGYNALSASNRIGKIGYWLDAAHQGQGIMTRAVGALVQYGWSSLNLNRQVIAAATGNTASRAIAERLGFQLEGIARQAEWLYDRFVDHAIYSRLRCKMTRETYYTGDAFPTAWERHFVAGRCYVGFLGRGNDRVSIPDRPWYGSLRASLVVEGTNGRRLSGGEHDELATDTLRQSGVLDEKVIWEKVIDGVSTTFRIREADVDSVLDIIENWSVVGGGSGSVPGPKMV